eukprot:597579_1
MFKHLRYVLLCTCVCHVLCNGLMFLIQINSLESDTYIWLSNVPDPSLCVQLNISVPNSTSSRHTFHHDPSMNLVITYNSTPQLMAIRCILSMKPKTQQTTPKHEDEEIEIECETVKLEAGHQATVINQHAMDLSLINSGRLG